MAALTITSAARAATPLTFVAADVAGDTFPNTGREAVLVQHTNGAGSSVTVTVITTALVDGEAVADKVIVVAPGETHLIGPWPKSVYSDSSGLVSVGYSAVTDMTVVPILIA